MEQLLMKISEVAQALGISKSTTYAMAAKGEIPVVQIRGGLRLPSEALRAWLNKTFSEQQNSKIEAVTEMRESIETVLSRLDRVRPCGDGWTASCPAHADHHPSLSVGLGDDGRVLLKCFKGCDFEAIIFALGFERDLYLASGSVRVAKDAGHERKDRIACASLLWDSALPAVGTLAHEYLRSRGIRIEPPWTLRFSMLKHRPSGLWLPAMVAAVVDVNAEFVGIHRTYLRPDGNGKANVEPVKMSLGPIGGGAVRLSPISQNLILCEGIETGLSIAQAIPDASVWVALSSSGLRIIELPRQVRTVTIAADNDETGEKAARAVAQRLVGEGRTVRIAQPSIGGFDFNDVLQKTH